MDDVNFNLIRYQKYKPADGVEFKQYDQFGFSLDPKDGFNNFISRDVNEAGFEYFPANEEQMEKVRQI